jgi:hypothetical protein
VREQHHLGGLFRRDPGLGTRLDRFLQTIGDRQTLAGDTHTLELLGAGFGFGLGDDRILRASALLRRLPSGGRWR